MDIYEIRQELNAGKTIYDIPLRVTYYARAYEKEMVDKVKGNKDLEEVERFAREYEKEMVEKFMAGYPVK